MRETWKGCVRAATIRADRKTGGALVRNASSTDANTAIIFKTPPSARGREQNAVSDLAATMTREAPLLVPLVEASSLEWIGCMRIYVSRRAARKKEDQ